MVHGHRLVGSRSQSLVLNCLKDGNHQLRSRSLWKEGIKRESMNRFVSTVLTYRLDGNLQYSTLKTMHHNPMKDHGDELDLKHVDESDNGKDEKDENKEETPAQARRRREQERKREELEFRRLDARRRQFERDQRLRISESDRWQSWSRDDPFVIPFDPNILAETYSFHWLIHIRPNNEKQIIADVATYWHELIEDYLSWV